jgi:hypothetical protein
VIVYLIIRVGYTGYGPLRIGDTNPPVTSPVPYPVSKGFIFMVVFVHYNKRVTCKVKRVDYEAEAFEWDPVEGSEVP